VDKQRDGSGEVAFRLGKVDVFADRSEHLNLNHIWEACGRLEGKEPWRYFVKPEKQSFIRDLAKDVGVEARALFSCNDQSNVWAHWQIAIDYAGMVSNQFKIAVGKAVREWVEEQRSPGLKFRRGAEVYLKLGYDAEWRNAPRGRSNAHL
jgi:hypothetical protein